ncbi:MAG TPA: hypothetical protein VFO85_10405, partial [Vicinamibacteria bacterium]|nr:hypothetical protein [Vicinamibacteria bacterium]
MIASGTVLFPFADWRSSVAPLAYALLVVLYLAVVSLAFRLPPRLTWAAAALYGASYLAMVALLGQVDGNLEDLAVRITYLLLAVALGVALAREVRTQTTERVRMADRVRAHEASLRLAQERAARAAAEEARHRSDLLADAGILLSASLDNERTMRAVSTLLVPAFADACCVLVLDEDGATKALAAIHVDDAQHAAVRDFARRHPRTAEALRTGHAQFLDERSRGDPELAALEDRVGMRSALI